MMRERNKGKLRKHFIQYLALCAVIVFLLSGRQVSANVLSPGSINTCGELASPGTYSLTANVSTSTGACFKVSSNGVTLTSSTTGSYTITGSIVGDGTSPGNPGFNFIVKLLTVTGTTSSNGAGFGTGDATDGSAGNAGNITISTSTLAAIQANGGTNINYDYADYSGSGGTIIIASSTFSSISANGGGVPNTTLVSGSTAGNGGSITVTAASLNLSGNSILASGGTGGVIGVNGSNGTLTLNYTTLNHTGLTLSSLSSLILNGPGNSPGNLGAFGAGVFGAMPGDTISTASQCDLGFAGTYTLGAGISGNCNITQNSVVLNGAGHTITGNVVGDGAADVLGYGYPGYSFTLENATVTGTTSANGFVSSSASSIGGTITIINSTTTGIAANGGSSTIQSGSNAGSVIISASSTNLSSTSFSLLGGTPGIYSTTNGSPGNLTVNYTTFNSTGLYLPPLSDLVLNGPGNSPGDLSAFAGGLLGTVPGSIIMNASQCVLGFAGTYTLGANITGNCVINANGVILNGSSTYSINGNVVGDNANGSGFNFTLKNITVTGTASSNAIGTTTVGTGGVITIATSTVATVTANGSVNSVSSGASVNGGSVAATSSTITSIQVNGGSDTGGSLGYGGSVALNNSTSTSIQANGSAGGGGSITVTGSSLNLSNMNISATGGGGSPVYGTLTLNYSILSYSNLTLSALSTLALNGPGNSPGNLGAFAGGIITAISPGGTITSIAQCFLTSAGTYTLGNSLTGNCSIKANNVIVNGAGFTINGNITGTGSTTGLIYSLQNLTVTGTTSADGASDVGAGGAYGGNAGSITLATSTVGSVTANGGYGTSGGTGGYGGSIIITNSTTTSAIQSNGGVAGTGVFFYGYGGTITITKPNIDLTGVAISASQGTSTSSTHAGSLTLNYTTLNFANSTVFPVLSDLVLNGPGNLPGDMGAWSGGVLGTAPGGTVNSISNCNFIESGTYYLGSNLSGNCTIDVNGVTINGEGHTLTGNMIGDGPNTGHSFALQNITVTGTTSANATNSFNGGVTGGSITVSSSTLATTTANSPGGNAGSVAVTNSTVSSIQVNGDTLGIHGGNGGSITMTNGVINLASTTISASGVGNGTLTLNYTTLNAVGAVLPALSDLILNGPGGLPGDLGAFAGGAITLPGSNITTASQCDLLTAGTYTLGNNITGNCYILADGVTLNGAGYKVTGNVIGDGAVAGKRGNNFTIQNITVTGTTTSNGYGFIGTGAPGNPRYGMPGGAITIVNSTSTAVQANGYGNGGLGSSAYGGYGGSITVTNSAIILASTTFSAAGGTGSISNGTNGSLTLNYTTLNFAGATLPALSGLVLNGAGNLPGNVGPFYGGTFQMQNVSNISQCTSLSSPGVYTFTTSLTGNCTITGNGVILNGAGYTLNGNVQGNGPSSGNPGRTFTVENLTVSGGGISSNGSVSGTSNGGSITVIGSTINLSSLNVSALGYNGGTNGSLALYYTTLQNYGSSILPALSDLVLNGPGNLPGDIGAFSGAFTIPGATITSASQCPLLLAGTYTVGSNFTGNCRIYASGIALTGATTTINGNIIGDGIFPGGSGYNFSLNGVTASGTVSSNGAVNTNGVGGNGGSIVITDGTINLATTTLSANGAIGSSGTGTNGTLTLNYSTLSYVGVSVSPFSDLVLNGPNNLPGNVGAFGGGFISVLPGSTITNPTELAYLNLSGTYTLGNDITGDATIVGSGIVINGAGHTLNGSVMGDGSHFYGPGDWAQYGIPSSSFTLENITVTGTTSANGTNFYPDTDYQPGIGGSITISNSTVATTTANGGYATEYHDAANAGTITINNSTAAFVQADGGAGSYYGGAYRNGAGGNGGTITIDPSVTGAVEANGGASPVKPSGNGGTISITNSTANPVGSTVTANGGDSTVCGYGGNGGTINMVNSTYGTASANSGANQLSGGCNIINNQSISSSGSYSGGAVGGSNGSVQVVGQYLPPGLLPVISQIINSVIPGNDTIPSPTSPSASFGSGSSGSSIGAPSASQQPPQTVPSASFDYSSFGSAVAATAQTIARNVAGTARAVANSSGTRPVQTAGFLAGLVASVAAYAETGVAAPLAASEIFLIPMRLWGLALVGLGIRKRGRPWGTVYDSVTKQPIDPAFVTVKDMSGKVVGESITDLDGRYGFLLPDGTYYISVKKTNYEFPSKKMSGRSSDELYNDLYFGEPVAIKSGQVLDKNIPLDQKNFDWNEQAKKDRNLMLFHSQNERIWAVMSKYIYGVGLAISTIVVLAKPSSYNILILVAYALVLAFLEFGIKKKKLGYVLDKATGEPLSYAIFRVTTLDHKVVLRSGVCDAKGRYYCIVPKGRYYVDIERKNPDGSYTKAFESEPINSDSGFINMNFIV